MRASGQYSILVKALARKLALKIEKHRLLVAIQKTVANSLPQAGLLQL